MHLPEPLSALTPAEQELLGQYFETVKFDAGHCIFRARDAGDACYLIDEGEVRIEIERDELDSDGVLQHLGVGAILGELSLLDHLPRSASAYAQTDVSARKLSSSRLDELCSAHPRIGLSLLHALGRDAATKLRQTTEKLADFMFEGAPDPEVNDMVRRAGEAQQMLESWPEDKIDDLLLGMAQAVAARAEELAKDTVKETRLGNVADKTLKNQVASLGVYKSLAGRKGSGALQIDDSKGVTDIASPAGVIFGIVPMTNPVATAVFKTLICLKGRNALIMSFHRAALGVGGKLGEILRGILEAKGAPPDAVQWIRERSSRKKTAMFMGHPGVSLILATGGAGMVKAAYSSGTPSIGVGPGNAPCFVASDADPVVSAGAIVQSKSFDNGLICGAEHNLLVDRSIRAKFIEGLERAGAAVLSPDEAAKFAQVVVDPETDHFRPQLVGQSAQVIAQFTGIERGYPIKLIVVPVDANEARGPFAGEKMAPLLSLFTVDGEDQAIVFARTLLRYQGTGHTAAIHSSSPALVQRFAAAMPASRILANTPAVHGVVGLTTGLDPSFTLGCGTFGRNSTTDNVSYRNLLNIKRLAHYVEPTLLS
jgi:acyl-CoA reductase-like NAD-dependent aldehyde dehydrogenase